MRSVRHPVHLGVDAVVEVGDVVVRDDVAGAVEADAGVGLHHRRILLTLDVFELLPERTGPADQVFVIVAADEHAVGDVEVARTRVVGEDAHADVLEPAALHRQSLGAGDELRARPDRDLRVPEGDPLEVVVVGGLDVEQVEVVAAVDDHLAVARRFDHDRFLRRALARQVVRPLERRGRVDGRLVAVELVVVGVSPGVDEDGVAGLHARAPAGCGVTGAAPVVVGAHDPFEGRLGLRSLPLRRVDVIGLAAGGGHRLRARADGHDLRRVRRRAVDAVGIRHHEARLVGGAGFEIEDAAGKHVRRDEVEDVALEDLLAVQPRQRHRLVPGGLALLAVRDLDAGIAIGVAVDVPLEPEVDQRRMLDDELARRDFRVSLRGHRTVRKAREEESGRKEGCAHRCADYSARRSAARASRRVESSVGSGEFPSCMISGISVQPSTTASHPSPFMRPITC